MRPRTGRPGKRHCFCWRHVLLSALVLCRLAAQTGSSDGLLSDSALARAQADVERIRTLVAEGSLPKSRLQEAEERLADVQDDQVLAHTLYSSARIEDMTEAQSLQMQEAAQRRLRRQEDQIEHKRTLLRAGILAPAELQADQEELGSRERVMQLVENRRRLISELHAMAITEQRLSEAMARNRAASANVMIRFNGSGIFHETELTGIAQHFSQQFGLALPVSATGQTAVHDSLGLDHRGRVDVALNPESVQGLWLRRFLEQKKIPYLAFRSAVQGAATGPHIHIGPESTRLSPVVAVHPHN